MFNGFSNLNNNNLNIFSNTNGPGGYYTYNQGLALSELAFKRVNLKNSKLFNKYSDYEKIQYNIFIFQIMYKQWQSFKLLNQYEIGLYIMKL